MLKNPPWSHGGFFYVCSLALQSKTTKRLTLILYFHRLVLERWVCDCDQTRGANQKLMLDSFAATEQESIQLLPWLAECNGVGPYFLFWFCFYRNKKYPHCGYFCICWWSAFNSSSLNHTLITRQHSVSFFAHIPSVWSEGLTHKMLLAVFIATKASLGWRTEQSIVCSDRNKLLTQQHCSSSRHWHQCLKARASCQIQLT